MKFNIEDVVYTVECLPEDMQVRGNLCASGDDELDQRDENKVIADLEWNPWAWCVVKVTASWNGLEGVDYLGGCSYASQKDFTQLDGYYADMKAEALADLKRTIRDMQKVVCGVEVV